MVRLIDPILTPRPPADRLELQPLGEPESLEAPASYLSTAGATVLTSTDLAAARCEAVPPTPSVPRFGEQVSHMTDRFVLSASRDMYRIWRFQSAYPAIEFPVTENGWAQAWTTFRELESQAA
jgi:hypothetical protein